MTAGRIVCLMLVAVFGFAPRALAHDPGLSTLDVRVGRTEVIAIASLDPSDARLLTSVARADGDGGLARWIRDAVHLRIDARPLNGRVGELAPDGAGGARVRLHFDRPAGDLVSVTSGIAERAGRGHRTLISIGDGSGLVLAERLTDAANPGLEVALHTAPESPVSAAGFFRLGVEHILTGYDHLLFLVGLLLVAWRTREALLMVSAFTVAHSVTLALSTLALVSAPAEIVEPAIAASMVYVGAENVLRREPRSRWLVTFAFGLVHGLAFSGALRELGVGRAGSGVAMPLATFNLGVETGQVAVAAVVLPLVRFAQARRALRTRLLPACSVAVAVIGSWWLVERLR